MKFSKNENDPGVWRYVLAPELYSSLTTKKVIKEAALRSGVSQGVMQACCFFAFRSICTTFSTSREGTFAL